MIAAAPRSIGPGPRRSRRLTAALLFAPLIAGPVAAREEPPSGEIRLEPCKATTPVMLRGYMYNLEHAFTTEDLARIARVSGRLDELDLLIDSLNAESRKVLEDHERRRSESEEKRREREKVLLEQIREQEKKVEAIGGEIGYIALFCGKRFPTPQVDDFEKGFRAKSPGQFLFKDPHEGCSIVDAAALRRKREEETRKWKQGRDSKPDKAPDHDRVTERGLRQSAELLEEEVKKFEDGRRRYDEAMGRLLDLLSEFRNLRTPPKPPPPEISYTFESYLFIEGHPDASILDQFGAMMFQPHLVNAPRPLETKYPEMKWNGYASEEKDSLPEIAWSFWRDGEKVLACTGRPEVALEVRKAKDSAPAAPAVTGRGKVRGVDTITIDLPTGEYDIYAEARYRESRLVDRRKLIHVGGDLPVEVPQGLKAPAPLLAELRKQYEAYRAAREVEAKAQAAFETELKALHRGFAIVPQMRRIEEERQAAREKVRAAVEEFYGLLAFTHDALRRSGDDAARLGDEALRSRALLLRAARIAALDNAQAAQERERISLRPSRVQFAEPEFAFKDVRGIRPLIESDAAGRLVPGPEERGKLPERWRESAGGTRLYTDAEIEAARNFDDRDLKPFTLPVWGQVTPIQTWFIERMRNKRWAAEEFALALMAWDILGYGREAFAQLEQLEIIGREIAAAGPKPVLDNPRILEAKRKVVATLADRGILSVLRSEAAAEDLLDLQRSRLAGLKGIAEDFGAAWSRDHTSAFDKGAEFFFLTAKTPYSLFDLLAGAGSDAIISGVKYATGWDWKTRDGRVQERIDKLRAETTRKLAFLRQVGLCDVRQLQELDRWHKGKPRAGEDGAHPQLAVQLPGPESGMGYQLLVDDRRFAEATGGGLTRILGAIDVDPVESRANEFIIAREMTALIRRDALAAHRTRLGYDPETGRFVWSVLLKPITAFAIQADAAKGLLSGDLALRDRDIGQKASQEAHIDQVRKKFASCRYASDPEVLYATSPMAYILHIVLLETNPDYIYAWLSVENCDFLREICFLQGLLRESPADDPRRDLWEHKVRLARTAARANVAAAEPLILRLRFRDALLAYDYYQALAILDAMRARGCFGNLARPREPSIDEARWGKLMFDDRVLAARQAEIVAGDKLIDDRAFNEVKAAIQWEITKETGKDVLANWGHMGLQTAALGYAFGRLGIATSGGTTPTLGQYLIGVANPFSGGLQGWGGLAGIAENIIEEGAEEAIAEGFRSGGMEDENAAEFLGMCAVETFSAFAGKAIDCIKKREVSFEQDPTIRLTQYSFEGVRETAGDLVRKVTDHPFVQELGRFRKAADEVLRLRPQSREWKAKVRERNAARDRAMDYLNVWAYAKRKWALADLLSRDVAAGKAEILRAAMKHWTMKLRALLSLDFDYERRLSAYVKRVVAEHDAALAAPGGEGRRVELAAAMLRQLRRKELSRIRGVEVDGEPLLAPADEKKVVDAVRVLAVAAREATARRFGDRIAGFLVEGSSADPESREFRGVSSDDDVTALVRAGTKALEVKAFHDSFFRRLAGGVSPAEWQIEFFQDRLEDAGGPMRRDDMEWLVSNVRDLQGQTGQRERYIVLGTHRLQRLTGRLRGVIYRLEGGKLIAVPASDPLHAAVYGGTDLCKGDGLDIVADMEGFVGRYERQYEGDPAGLVTVLARYNIREMVGAMASSERGLGLLRELTPERSRQLGGPHFAFVDAAGASRIFTAEEYDLARRWRELKAGEPPAKVFRDLVDAEVARTKEAAGGEIDEDRVRMDKLQDVLADHLKRSKAFRARALDLAMKGRIEYEMELQNERQKLRERPPGTTPEEAALMYERMIRIDRELDLRAFSLLAVAQKKLTPEALGRLRDSGVAMKDRLSDLWETNLQPGGGPAILSIDLTLSFVKTMSTEPSDPHIEVDNLEKPEEPPSVESLEDFFEADVDRSAALRIMVEKDKCPHW
jgi:hypothetical protein